MEIIEKKRQPSIVQSKNHQLSVLSEEALVPEYLQQALQLHRDGKFDQAASQYEAILNKQSNHFDARHLLGVLRSQQGRHMEALTLINSVLERKPNNITVLTNLGQVLRAMGRNEEALVHYERALSLNPDLVEVLDNSAIVLTNLTRLEQALLRYDKVLLLKPKNNGVWARRGHLLKELARPEEALVSYDKALELKPDNAEVLKNRGDVLKDLNRSNEALASYDRSLALKPHFVDALNSKGNLLQDLNRLDEALASYAKALELKSDNAATHCNRGGALAGLNRSEEALSSFDRALMLKPDFAEALNNRGVLLKNLNRPDEALASYDKALEVKPDFAEAHNNRGIALKNLSRPGEALTSFDKALALKPDYSGALFNKGLYYLTMGDFERGWKGYESRWERKGHPARKLISSDRVWKGEDVHGKRIIVYEEQGLGDIIQFSRFLPLLTSQGADVTFILRRKMHRLMQKFATSISFEQQAPSGKKFDFQCALGSLPGVFGTNLTTIPADVPYLEPEAPLVTKWRQRIGHEGFKVGICWQGSPTGTVDIGRSFPLQSFRPLSAVPGVRLISLQKNHGLDQLDTLPDGMTVETLGDDFDSGPDAFVDTAAAMANLDLIITSDTSIAHLAGALGRPFWVVLKQVPDWRWMLNRTDSPWYPTAKLYRQNVRDDWEGVFNRIATDLTKLNSAPAHTESSLQLPGSIGELFDKITILEIKAARIMDSEKLRNVRRELDLLRMLEKQKLLFSDELTGLVKELKQVNEELWEIEDAIRFCERQQDFSDVFISLARSVYKTNDRRAEIKKEINLLYGSEIIEEKSYAAQK